MTSNLLILLALFTFSACGGPADNKSDFGSELTNENEQAFFNNLAEYCGKSFAGEQVFLAEGRESWAHKDFVMHVQKCGDDHIHVPFHLDEDQSRTWMFLVEEGRLRFRHDHRHEDGTPEEETMYGGYADSEGTAFRQDFPADQYTCELLPTACEAVWRVELTEDPKTFRYSLFSEDGLLFTAAFDLEKPL